LTFKLYVQLHDKNLFTLAYPSACLYVLCVIFLLFVMIINLLMWADARTFRGHQGDGDSTT